VIRANSRPSVGTRDNDRVGPKSAKYPLMPASPFLTQEELAERLGVSRSAVRRSEMIATRAIVAAILADEELMAHPDHTGFRRFAQWLFAEEAIDDSIDEKECPL